MSDKQQLSLYRILPESVFSVAKEKKYDIRKLESSKKQIEYIINLVDGRRRPSKLKLDGKTIKTFSPLKLDLYFCRIPLPFQWQEFFGQHLDSSSTENSIFFKCKTTHHASFLCFIYDEQNIFAFTGGLGNGYIKDFVDEEFGIGILQRIANPDTLLLRMAKDNNLVGNVAVGQRHYRGDQKVYDENSMGKIFNNVVGNVPYSKIFKEVKELIFDGKIKGRTNIKAKASLSFARALSFTELKQVIDFVTHIPTKNRFQFSKIRMLTGRRRAEKILIQHLESSLRDDLFKTLEQMLKKDDYSSQMMLEVMDSDFESFFSSTRLVVRRTGNPDVYSFDSPYGLSANDLLRAIINSDRDYLLNKFQEINEAYKREKPDLIGSLINKYSLQCFIDEVDSKAPVIDKKIKDLITCEVSYGGAPYFKMMGKWHKSSESFIKDLDSEFGSIHNACYWEFPIPINWGADASDDYKENENLYLEYLAENVTKNTFVFHKVLPSTYKIELCDFLFWDNNDLYLVHIKPSFDGAVRLLEKQIVHSAKLVSEDLRTDIAINGHLKRYFDEAKNYAGPDEYRNNISKNLDKVSFKKFLDLFQKRINFVACIVDPKSKRDLSDINKFKSNIAKMSLIETYREIRSSGIPRSSFRITQIPVDSNYHES